MRSLIDFVEAEVVPRMVERKLPNQLFGSILWWLARLEGEHRLIDQKITGPLGWAKDSKESKELHRILRGGD